MSKLTRDEAISAGGKVWTKNEIERIYLNVEAVSKIITKEGYPAFTNISKKMQSAKTYLDVKSGEVKSDVGMIRSALNSAMIKCVK